MENTQDYIKKIFTLSNSEIYTGNLKEYTIDNNTIKSDYSILYRCCKSDSSLYFLLYDFKALYYSKQSFSEIQKINKELNPSLDFDDISALMKFIFDNIIKAENGLLITQIISQFNFEVLVDIVKVKWSFKCEFHSDYELIQNLFVKPIINVLFGFQHFLTSERAVLSSSNNNPGRSEINVNDVSIILGNLEVSNQKNFNKNLLQLTADSTEKVNSKEEINNKLNKGELNLKRKDNQTNFTKEKANQNIKKKSGNVKKDEEKANEREKSSERTEEIIFSSLSENGTGERTGKPKNDKKKKEKLKFV